MERQIMWSPWMEPGLEHLHIYQQRDGIVADGLILGVKEQVPFRVRYEIRCDLQWRLRAVHVSVLGGTSSSLHLLTDGEGSWTTAAGEAIPALKGCLDVDISATPFTNTLPIRRFALRPGASATLNMAYIEVPQMHVEVTEQRYTCLEASSSGGRYRFESLTDGICWFTADLPVDEDGLVLDYPELFRRVGAG
ncbi:MAG: putative glycolipid-binding domain-containing protein [Chloroflexota bacterium]|nr:putative glycolipid-binding domain-containing protein [Chloroflexota bacterium]